MKAVTIAEYGGLEVLELTEQPRPPIAADQVLVRVRAAAVNPIDWRMRSGALARFIECDLSGDPGPRSSRCGRRTG